MPFIASWTFFPYLTSAQGHYLATILEPNFSIRLQSPSSGRLPPLQGPSLTSIHQSPSLSNKNPPPSPQRPLGRSLQSPSCSDSCWLTRSSSFRLPPPFRHSDHSPSQSHSTSAPPPRGRPVALRTLLRTSSDEAHVGDSCSQTQFCPPSN